MGRIIIVEDNLTFSGYVCRLLESKGFQTACTSTCNGARKLFAKICEDDIVLADLRLNDGDGILLLKELRKQGKDNPYIIMTDYDEVPTAVKSMKLGAEDYIPKKLLEMSLPPLLKTLQEKMELHDTPIHERQSAAFREIDHKIKLVATTNMSVLILGESGTGKEVIAEGIHYASGRRRGPFIRVNCGAIPGALLESELFGHEKGAFTGAVRRKLGKFELANHGTIFLDEIGELDKNLQVKLLRVLQQKEFDRVGGEETIHVDVRIIAATNRDLEAMVREGTFRDDLYYRLNVIPIILPPLRDRPDDIPLLVEHFIEKISKENKKAVRGITPDAMQMFMHYRWPGNVRELENVIERVITLMDTDLITTAMLPSYIKGDIAGREVQSLADDTVLPWEEYEKQIIANALRQGTSFNGAAKLLRISHKTVAAKARKYGLV